MHDDEHSADAHDAAAFSGTIAELTKEEEDAKKALDEAERNRIAAIGRARQEAQELIGQAKAEAETEREELIAKERTKTAKDSAKILDAAEKEAATVRRGKDVKGTAKKLLPLIFE